MSDRPETTVGTVIVSGATFGIGHDIAVYLAEAGYRVVGFGLEAAPVSSVATASVTALNAEAEKRALPLSFIAGDVTSAVDVSAAIDHALSFGNGLYGVINNAAIGPLGTVLDTEPDMFSRILEVNLKGPYQMCRAAVPHMAKQIGRAHV